MRKGNGWKLPTFHNVMHIVGEMGKFGKPTEENTEVGEKNHKVLQRRWRDKVENTMQQFSIRLLYAYLMHLSSKNWHWLWV
jgi:hypothetical protein